MKYRSKITFALTAGLLLSVGSTGAFADIVTYAVGVPNTALSAYPEPYATVTVDRTDSTHAKITFDSVNNGTWVYLMGDGNEADVNVNATAGGWTIGTFTWSNAYTGFLANTLSDSGSGNVSSFGVFNQTVSGFDGFTHSASEVSYILTDTSGTWAAAADVLTPNADGFLAAVHGFVCADVCNAADGAVTTGFAANGTPAAVPEPASLSLFGGLAALGAMVLRNRKRA
jgi:hypothetical protein